jgi:hypothetical protein
VVVLTVFGLSDTIWATHGVDWLRLALHPFTLTPAPGGFLSPLEDAPAAYRESPGGASTYDELVVLMVPVAPGFPPAGLRAYHSTTSLSPAAQVPGFQLNV